MLILRVWKESKGSKATWTIWDRGDEIWELKGDMLRHFEVLERSSLNNVITERLRLLHESAIPLEAIRHSVQGWQVDESALSAQPSPRAKPELPLTSSPLSTPVPSPQTNGPLKAKKSEQGVKGKSSPRKATAVGPRDSATIHSPEEVKTNTIQSSEHPSEAKIHPAPPSQEGQEILEEESSQHFYNHPTEHWSSLSQWIPQHALFQPSLHHQATLELSDTPAQTYPYQIDSSKNSRTAQAQHQHARQGQHSKPYRPKPSLREIEIPKRPLFV